MRFTLNPSDAKVVLAEFAVTYPRADLAPIWRYLGQAGDRPTADEFRNLWQLVGRTMEPTVALWQFVRLNAV